jgi:hypothetical protein
MTRLPTRLRQLSATVATGWLTKALAWGVSTDEKHLDRILENYIPVTRYATVVSSAPAKRRSQRTDGAIPPLSILLTVDGSAPILSAPGHTILTPLFRHYTRWIPNEENGSLISSVMFLSD